MKRNDLMPLMLSSAKQNITYNDHETTTRNEETVTLPPYLVELLQKSRIVDYSAKLPADSRIFFQGPVGRRSDDKMNGRSLDLQVS